MLGRGAVGRNRSSAGVEECRRVGQEEGQDGTFNVDFFAKSFFSLLAVRKG